VRAVDEFYRTAQQASAAADQMCATMKPIIQLWHQIYNTIRAEGFTPEQAFDLVKMFAAPQIARMMRGCNPDGS
jgi:hypothetical protein